MDTAVQLAAVSVRTLVIVSTVLMTTDVTLLLASALALNSNQYPLMGEDQVVAAICNGLTSP